MRVTLSTRTPTLICKDNRRIDLTGRGEGPHVQLGIVTDPLGSHSLGEVLALASELGLGGGA